MATVVARAGTVRELHELDPFAEVGDAVEIWYLQPRDAAIVLGSRQSPQLVDEAACNRLGLDVVRRRSGGGAVLVVPERLVWVDIVAPSGTAPDDVRGSMIWAGELWRRALADTVDGELTVHTGSMVCTEWCNLVCFAGLGPGEVSLDGAKLVGLSQRRTRNGIRIQGNVYTAPPAIDIADVLLPPHPAVPMPAIATVDVDPDRLVGRLAAALASG